LLYGLWGYAQKERRLVLLDGLQGRVVVVKIEHHVEALSHLRVALQLTLVRITTLSQIGIELLLSVILALNRLAND